MPSLRHAVLPLAFALLGFAVGCAPAEEAGEDDSAEALARAGGVEGMAASAKRIAERLAAHDASIVQMPMSAPGAGLPSATVKEWHIALVTTEDEGVRRDGFMLIPAANAPRGSFGLVLVDQAGAVLGYASYVPDATPDASAWADKLLTAVDADGRARAEKAGQVATKGLEKIAVAAVTNAVEAAARLISSASAKAEAKEVKAGAAAAARVAARAQTTAWRDFVQVFKSAQGAHDYFMALKATRKALGSRKVVGVEAFYTAEADAIPVADAIIAKLARREKTIALAMVEMGDPVVARVTAWALDRKIPVVFTSETTASGADVLEGLARQAAKTDPATAATLRRLAADPEALANLRASTGVPWDDRWRGPTDALQSLSMHMSTLYGAMWALADEGLVVRKGSIVVPGGSFTNWDFIEAWFRRFETLTQISL